MTPEEYAESIKQQSIASNDARHKHNIEHYLSAYVEFCQQCNLIGAQKALHDYATAESRRLQDRAKLMERYGIERLPNPHGALACSYHEQAQVYIQANIARDSQTTQANQPERVIAPSLWQPEMMAS